MYPFHMPGHKRRVAPCKDISDIYGIDITEIDDFDNLHEAQGIIKEAEERAAKLFGADETHFLVNGSTGGILAAVCGSVHEGDTVYMARNCHKSVYNAVMLSRAVPVYIYPKQESIFEINAGIESEQIENAILENPSSGNSIVIITSPTYEGVISDIAKISEVCHKYNATLIVDAAHGAHLGFGDFPQSPIALGADVVIASVHKTLMAPTQTAVIHIAKSSNVASGIRKMLKVFQTSSPSYVLMAGIEGCVDSLAENGKALFDAYEALLNDFYAETEKLVNIGILSREKLTCAGSADFDRSKIVLSDKSGKLTGKQLYDLLRTQYQLQPEMAAGGYCLLMTSPADSTEAFDRLTAALKSIDKMLSGDDNSDKSKRGTLSRLYDRFLGSSIRKIILSGSDFSYDYNNEAISVAATAKMSQSDAMFCEKTEFIPVELSVGRTSAGSIVPYPPGVPIAVAGELLSEEMVDEILKCMNKDLSVNGINENKEIEVIWEKSSV